MSTTIFAGSTAGIVYEGGVPDGSQFNTPNFFGGEYIQQAVGTNAKLRVNFTGTDCDLYVYCDGGSWGWTIDGGSLQTASPSGGNMQWLNVATGLSDTTHTLVLINIRYFVGWDKILRVTGASPALSAPSGYTNPQFGFTSSGVTRDGSAYRTSAVEGYVGLTDHGSCRFKATTSEIKVWNRYDSNSPIGLVVDDDITTLVRQNPSSGYGWTTFTGLDGSAEHSYRFIIPSGVYFYNFMAAGLNTTALTPYPADYWMGDSITANSTITNGDAAPSYWTYYAIKAKRGWQVQAQGGATAATQGVAWKTYPGLASPTPDRVIIAFGTNDLSNAESSATWTSAITTLITQVNSDLPTKKVIWLGLFDTTFNHANRGTYNTDLSNTIAAYGNSLVTYFSSDGAGLISTSDSVHFDASGSATYGNYLYSNLPGSNTTITASITQGSVSLTAESLPLVSLIASASITQGSVALTSQTLPSVAKGVTASITQGSVALTAETLPSVALSASASIVQGAVSLTAETLPSVSLSANASITQGSVALTAQTLPLVSKSANAAITQGSVSLTAQTLPAVTLSASASIVQGSVSLAPQTVTATIVPASPPGSVTASIVQGSVSLSGQQVTTAATFGASITKGSVALTAEPLPSVSLAVSASIIQGSVGLTAEPVTFAYVPSNNVAVLQGLITLTAFPINVQISSAAISAPFNIVASENGWSVTVVDSVATVTVREYVDIVRFS